MKNNMLLQIKVMFELAGLNEQVKRTKNGRGFCSCYPNQYISCEILIYKYKNNIEIDYNCYFDSDMD